jgi:hypothetical protein
VLGKDAAVDLAETSPAVADTSADTPAAFSGVHFTSNWSTERPPASRTSSRIRALSCQDNSDRHFTDKDFAFPRAIFAMISSAQVIPEIISQAGTFLKTLQSGT